MRTVLILSLLLTASVARAEEITFSGVGDMVFGRSGKRFGLDKPFSGVKHLFKGRDIVYGNLETPITATRYLMTRKPRKCPVRKRWCNPTDAKRYARLWRLTFYGRPKALSLLRGAGFTLLGTANNHAEDQGRKGLLETIQQVRKAGMAPAGTGATPEEAWKPFIYRKGGTSVGVIVATSLWNFPPMKGGSWYALAEFPRKVFKILPAKVRALKAKVDFVVVALHFGEEYNHRPYNREMRLMKALEKAGCDLFIGGHPHVLRGIQVINRMVAFWSMGNFLFDATRGPQGESGIAHATFVKSGTTRSMKDIFFYPVRLNGTEPGRKWGRMPTVVKGTSARRLLKKMLRYSRWLKNSPGEITIDKDRIAIRPKAFTSGS